jgi:DNA polymerase-1
VNARLTFSPEEAFEIWRGSLAVSFDFETWKIEQSRQFPPAVCMSWTEIVPCAVSRIGIKVGRSSVVIASEGVELLQRGLDAGVRIIGANTAFDSLVSVVKSDDYMRLLRSWVTALEAGRVHDVFVREKLLRIANGTFKFDALPDGKFAAVRYNLASLAWSQCRRKLSKPEDLNDVTHWRLRYGELDGVPIAQYPDEAYDYSLEDAIGTAEVFIAQEVQRFGDKRIAQNFPGKDPFIDEARQTIVTIPLKAMSAYGLRTDAAAVERLVEEVEAKIEEARTDLVEAGLVREPAYSRNTEKILAYIRAIGAESFFRVGHEVKLCKANYLAAATALNNGYLYYLAHWKQVTENVNWRDSLVAIGLVDVDHSRDTKAAAERCVEAYKALGKVAPRTDSYDPTKHGPLDCISLDADSCTGSEDPILVIYSEYQSLAKTLSNDIPMLRAGAYLPVHSRFDELKETGRTGSSKPNVQNVRRLPGIRECFMPRPGMVFIDTDFGGLELHTLAQVCLWVLGFSTLAEALNSGKDPHLIMACAILKITYDEAKARREAGDAEVDNARTAGKGANFGRAGGLSAKTFVVYAWTNYRIRMTLEEAQTLLEIYDRTWKEMPSYFRWIKGLKDVYYYKLDEATGREMTRYNVVQPWSGRLRAGTSYCAACNSPFQGLGADVAKLALWLVWKATMGLSELGTADPLYGCRIVNFVHDSIMTEAQRARAHAAAMRQKELMDLAGRLVLPDCPVKADMLVTERWSKKAQQTRVACQQCGASGKCGCKTWNDRELIPWDPRIASLEALSKFAKKAEPEQVEEVSRMRGGMKWVAMEEPGREVIRSAVRALPVRVLSLEYLKKKEWPSDIARAAVVEMFGVERMAA